MINPICGDCFLGLLAACFFPEKGTAMRYACGVGRRFFSAKEEIVMDVGSVATTAYSTALTASAADLRARAREQELPVERQGAQQTPKTVRPEAQKAASETEAAERQRNEAPAPVVNSSGQLVGQRINTTA